jgi:Family of unknown function (DUF5906)
VNFKLTFLEADQPLVKSYWKDENGKLQKESYPRVAEFTSHLASCNTITEFTTALQEASTQGWCLLKGELTRPLVHESRAGSTDSNALTRWIVLDFDRLPIGTLLNQALNYLGLGHVDHIIQYSASQGIEPARGDTGHVFFLLTEPTHPAALKQWLIGLNLKTECLRVGLELTKTNNALSWPLDISTCQNDKLLYLAAPTLSSGIEPWTGERIQLILRSTKYLEPSTLYVPSAEENRAGINTTLDALRAQRSLPARKWQTKIDRISGLEILVKPDQATLTGCKQERGFTYFNLNGGDSWGYFHPDDAPEVIRNFKGEPFYSTKELLPEYWAHLQRKTTGEAPDSQAVVILAFRDFNTSLYYNGLWYPSERKLKLARAASETQLQHFLLEHGRPRMESIPDWTLTYDPTTETVVDTVHKTINRYEPSVYIKQEVTPVATLDGCPIIRRIMQHAVAYNPVTFEHWLNWVTCIFKLRQRTQTSWVLHGVQGTGKGLIVNKILIPLLGPTNVAVRRMEELEDQFNGYLEYSQLVVIDEAQISESKKSSMIMANSKNQITEPWISVRNMHTQGRMVQNFCSHLFLSNQPGPIQIEPSDRRHNVGEYRGDELEISDEEVKLIENELPTFANYLHTRVANAKQARTVLITADRAEIMAASSNSIETTAQALLKGDLEFFWDALPAGDPGILGPEQQALYESYFHLMRSALTEVEHILTRDELRVLFAYNIGDVPRTPAKFTNMLRHHRVIMSSVWKNGKTVRGLTALWTASPEWKKQRLQEITQPPAQLRSITCS